MNITPIIEKDYELINSRFNAHLTFNILNTLQYLVLEEQKEEAYNLINSYSRLLRNMLITGSEPTTVGKEIGIIHDYLELERIRMDEKFSYMIDIPKSLGETSIPGSVIISLVENAVKHGIKKLGNSAYVLIDSPSAEKKTIRIKNNTPSDLCPRKNGHGLEITKCIVERHNLKFGTNIGVEHRSYISKSDTNHKVFEVVVSF